MNVKYVKKVEKGFLDTAVDYQLDAAASEADLGQDPGEVGRGGIPYNRDRDARRLA